MFQDLTAESLLPRKRVTAKATNFRVVQVARHAQPSGRLELRRSNVRTEQKNADGSYDVYFGPKPPVGHEKNWVQTVPGKSWWVILRRYGALEPWFDKTWQPDDIGILK